MAKGKKPCPRCLLEDISDQDISRAITARIASIPEEQRVSAEEYGRRLQICRDCDMRMLCKAKGGAGG